MATDPSIQTNKQTIKNKQQDKKEQLLDYKLMDYNRSSFPLIQWSWKARERILTNVCGPYIIAVGLSIGGALVHHGR